MTELQAMAIKALLDAAEQVRHSFFFAGESQAGMASRIQALDEKAIDVTLMFDGQLPE